MSPYNVPYPVASSLLLEVFSIKAPVLLETAIMNSPRIRACIFSSVISGFKPLNASDKDLFTAFIVVRRFHTRLWPLRYTEKILPLRSASKMPLLIPARFVSACTSHQNSSLVYHSSLVPSVMHQVREREHPHSW